MKQTLQEKYLGGNFLDVVKNPAIQSHNTMANVNMNRPVVVDTMNRSNAINTASRGNHPIMVFGNLKVVLRITRETNNINLPLPFALWSPESINDNYAATFKNTNTFPTSGTVVFRYDVNGDGLIIWTVGANTDIIRIHANGLSNYSLMNNKILNGGSFTSTGIRDITDKLFAFDMYSAYDLYAVISNFTSAQAEQSESVIVNVAPDQFQDGITDLNLPIAIDAGRGLVNGFPSFPATPLVAKSFIYAFWDVDFVSGGKFSS